jgi:hypothetical protein
MIGWDGSNGKSFTQKRRCEKRKSVFLWIALGGPKFYFGVELAGWGGAESLIYGGSSVKSGRRSSIAADD